MYKILSRLALLVLPLTIFSLAALPSMVSAEVAPRAPVVTISGALTCTGGFQHPKHYNGKVDEETCCPPGATDGTTCFIAKYVNPVVNLLSAAVGVVVVGSMIAGGIQYTSAGGDANKVAAAKQRIINSLLALAAFIFLYGFLQWIIPGGVSF